MAEKYFKKGMEYYKNTLRTFSERLILKLLKKSTKQFDKALKINPGLDLAWSYKGHNLAALGKPEQGLELINKALELNPSESIHWVHKALLYREQLNNYDDSVKCWYEAMKLEPNKYWVDLGKTHEEFKNYREAVECMEKGILYKPDESLYKKMKYVLLGGIKYKDNYYTIVTSYSYLRDIPLNTFVENEIVYASLMLITWLTPYSGKGYPTPTNFLTGVYFTTQGIMCYCPDTPQTKTFRGQLFPWSEAEFSRSNNIIIGSPKKNAFTFTLRSDKYAYSESKEEFKNRKKNFKKDLEKLLGRELP